MTETIPTLDFARTALVVMDYQNGLLDSLANAEELLATTVSAIAFVRERGGHVGYVRVAFTDSDFAAIPAASQMAAAVTPERREAMHADSPATAIADQLAPQPGDIVVRKTRVGAFSTTDLDQQLHQAGITTLVLAGVATSGVVLSTVREAADRDYQLLVLTDACADPDPEVHAFLTQKVFPRQARVITVAELASLR
jgi:nicotinamidase-related amidase